MFDQGYAEYQERIRERVEIALPGARFDGTESQLIWQPALAGIAEVIGSLAAQSGAYSTPKARRDLAKYVGDLVIHAMKQADRRAADGEPGIDMTVNRIPAKPN